MTEAGRPGSEEGDAFEAIDPRLTVFALANGMDLDKAEGYRRLEWFTEGLERGILIKAEDGQGFRVSVLSWKTGHAEDATEEPLGNDLTKDEVQALLTDAIETANGLAG